MTAQTSEIIVTARRWARGWELILDEDNATQVSSLRRAAEQVRDYLDTIDPETDHSGVRVTLVPEDQAIRQQIDRAREARQEAAAASAEAADLSRSVVRTLRRNRRYSQADSAALLGVTRERIGQLEKTRTPSDL